MGSSVAGAQSLNAFSAWSQGVVKGAQYLSIHITGGDANYGGASQQSILWAGRIVVQADPAGGSIRYRYDGNAPDGGAGMILTGGDSAAIEGFENIRRFRFASNQVTAGILQVVAERTNP